jgi:2-polyprenyl-6-methoxyphenol hydroxylase-like FAD-dependent oxidoreductase
VFWVSEDILAGIFVYPSLPDGHVPPPEDRKAALRDWFNDAPAVPLAVVAALPDPSLIYCDDMAQVVIPRWSASRVAMLGAAAWALSPMLGAEGGKAMRRAFVLARELTAGASFVSSFGAYEEDMRPAVEVLQRQTIRMAHFALDGRPHATLLKQALFRLMPERVVVRMRSAPPKGTAFERTAQ